MWINKVNIHICAAGFDTFTKFHMTNRQLWTTAPQVSSRDSASETYPLSRMCAGPFYKGWVFPVDRSHPRPSSAPLGRQMLTRLYKAQAITTTDTFSLSINDLVAARRVRYAIPWKAGKRLGLRGCRVYWMDFAWTDGRPRRCALVRNKSKRCASRIIRD